MAAIHLNSTEEALFIILTVLLSIIIISLIIIIYKKRSYLTRQRDEHLWHDFIMIDNPDHMIALKNSESLSFDSRRRGSSAAILHQKSFMLQSPNTSMSTISVAADDSDPIHKYNNTTTPLPQSPPPVYHNNNNTNNNQ